LALDTLKHCAEGQESDIVLNTHRLRTLSHLGLSEQELARNEAIKLLKLDPIYKPSILNDPTEFVRLINSITVLPKFSFGLSFSAGTNLTTPRVEKVFSAIEHTSRTYEGKGSYIFGISGLYQFNDVLALKMGLLVSSNKYEVDYPSENLKLNLKESLTYGMVPLGLRYSPKLKSSIRPFAQIGLTNSLLVGTNSSYFSDHLWFEETNKLERVSSNDRRNKFIYSLDVGLGAVKALGPGLISVEMNYMRSMRLANKGSARFNNPTLSSSYFHLDDDFYLDNLSFVLGYSVILNYQVLEK